MTMDFKTGDRVVNRAKPGWGPGEVLHAENGIALVRFDSGAVRKLAASFLGSAPPAAKHAMPGTQNSPAALGDAGKEKPGDTGAPAEGDGLIERALAMLRSMEQDGR